VTYPKGNPRGMLQSGKPSAHRLFRATPDPVLVCALMERLNCAISNDAQWASAGKLARRNFDVTAHALGRER